MAGIFIPGRAVKGKCRVCLTPFFDGDSEFIIARHMQKCGEEFAARGREQRRDLDEFLAPADPEWAAFVRSGRHRPSTERIK